MLWLWISLSVVGAVLIFYFLPTLLISNVIFTVLFVRDKKDKWTRTVSWDNEEQRQMFALGAKWGEKYEKYMTQVSIQSGKFKLVGDYFDFGNKKAVIVIPGRMEAGTYSYYFSEPYRLAGYNVMAIDNRSHGLSEGRYNTIGLKEYKDILNWAKFLHDEKGIETIVIHGICIGSATALYACVAKNSPDYIKGMVADGMYVNFHESLKNHLIEKKKPTFPFTGEIMGMMWLVAGKSAKIHSPIREIKKLKKPILFIYSKEDTYSVPELGQKLYDTCPSPKRLVWFDHGVHSHVRINDEKKYDQTVVDFLKDFVNE